jgi:hypothetical protein
MAASEEPSDEEIEPDHHAHHAEERERHDVRTAARDLVLLSVDGESTYDQAERDQEPVV